MATKTSSYSDQAAKKTLYLVVALISIVVVCSVIALYLINKQTSVLIQPAEKVNTTNVTIGD